MRAFSRPRIGRARALVRYFRDPSASVLGKLFVLATVVYVICPVDLIPDVPVVGWLDDLGFASLAVAWLARVVGKYRDAPRVDVEPDRLSEALP
jgi:uncharacterized membrane protein YkvA (DUF1232 family)